MKNLKDRTLVMQTAGAIAGTLAGVRDAYLKGRSVDKKQVAEDAVEIAMMILAIIDKPEVNND